MLQFKQDDTAAKLILTLSEYVSIQNPFYLFVFTHILTKDQVIFIKSSVDDESAFTGRYNQFTINAATVFTDKQPGEWHYKVYEQDANVNLNPQLSGAVLEYGKMILQRAADFEFTKYDQPTSYKTYNG